MTTQSMVCGSCAAAVPYGRLSCPSCGELLASVAGGRRVGSGAVTSTATPSVLYEVEAAPMASVVDGELAIGPLARVPDAGLPWGLDDDLTDEAIEGDAPADAAAGDTRNDTIDEIDEIDDGDDDDDDPLAPVARQAPAVLSSVPETAAASWAVAGLAPATTLAPDAPAPRASAPGAYLPPPPAPMQVAGPAAPARAWAGHVDGGGASNPTTSSAGEGASDGSVAAAARAATRVDEVVRWLAVAGSALSAAGFLLPWSSVVIGSPGASYFDRWGMAGPWHVAVVVGVLAVLVLALVANPIPVWVRVGLPGLGLGALLLGLVWPYLIGPLGAGPGVLMVVVGALLLGVAGVTALAVDRHVGADQPV